MFYFLTLLCIMSVQQNQLNHWLLMDHNWNTTVFIGYRLGNFPPFFEGRVRTVWFFYAVKECMIEEAAFVIKACFWKRKWNLRIHHLTMIGDRRIPTASRVRWRTVRKEWSLTQDSVLSILRIDLVSVFNLDDGNF